MIFRNAVLSEAEKWLSCRETSRNRSVCVDKIHKLFSDGWNGNADAWCAKFVWSITDAAVAKIGYDNPLYKSASTAQMFANTQLRKDNKPAKGAIFYTSRVGGGHVGFVEKVDGKYIHTIEGNTNNGGIDGVYRKKHDTTQKLFQFIHIEDFDTLTSDINGLLVPFGLTISDVATIVSNKLPLLLVATGCSAVAYWAITKNNKNKKFKKK